MEFNLETIKQEIESRRSSNLVNEQTTGTGRMGAPRDSKKFLVDLLNSVNNNGAPTPAVQALRQVTEVTDQRLGVPHTVGKPAPNITTGQYYTPPNNAIPLTEHNHSVGNGERDDSFFDQQMQKGMESLKYRGNTQPNAGLSQVLNEYSAAPFTGQPMGNGINPNTLNEHINKTMSDVMGGSNFTKIVEGAYKNMINEMYTKEKIETALVDILQGDTFKKLMKKLIVDTLIEIQNRNKK